MSDIYTDELKFVTEHRRYLHQHPELSLVEHKTTEYIISVLEDIGVSYYQVLSTGVIAVLNGNSETTLGFRADIDALPVHEQNDVEYKSSVDNVMHACGHDGHTTALLLFVKRAKTLSDEGKLKHNCVFIFQPSEEANAGANLLLNAWDNRPAFDAVFGVHLMPDEDEGLVLYRDGELTASATEYHFTVKGASAHVAQKHQGVSALETILKIASEVGSIQQFHLDGLNRNIIHMGKIQSGEAVNTVPANAGLSGTIRTYEASDLAVIKSQLTKIKEAAELLYGASVELYYTEGYPAVKNDDELRETVETSITGAGLRGIEKDKPYLFGEDFSFYSSIAKTYFVFAGSRSLEKGYTSSLHTDTFNFDERVLVKVADYYEALLNNY
ncbi:putative hydrolase [Jeotgalicoccus coquinae]|uniref:Amidohydrolase n=1 Tax=Jeotgalicoccus coquinae TaxID=709509 RepID=A0A6V7R819_9STAP|nr:M20 family metallopeptidase [Jeotgalicoccus coquinae]MBB6423002.1 amidohydrolase [Jeotgalicoccus coquinae]GGE11482.1 putative hydrolase [Jeotgalicoccus coquinae]CAD2073531.1 putative hydrolase YxeP [Jeotgalicoccus coquinae]